MDEMDIHVFYPGPNLSKRDKKSKVYPYLLRNLKIDRPNQVWAIDITYVGTPCGFAYMAAKLNKAQGPSVLCVPMRGWGACDLPEPDIELGWAGPGAGPVWVADPDHPQWSLRSVRYVEALRQSIDKNKENLEVILVDRHMNQPEFAVLMAELLTEMLEGRWTKGSHSDRPDIIPF
jgi:hypothetical protein